MINRSCTAAIEVNRSSHYVFKCITNDVAKWWGGRDLEGNTTKINDEFIINHPGTHFSKQKLIEVIPDKKIVWLVTESKLHWLKKNKHEWINTKIIFEITQYNEKTMINFTHEGLTPEMECYQRVKQGWDMVIKDWLFNFITSGQPHFQV